MNTKKNILLINSCHGILGGGEIYTIQLYKELIKRGHNVHFLVTKNSDLQNRLKTLDIPFYSYKKLLFGKNEWNIHLGKAVKKICLQNNIQLVHCNLQREVKSAKKATKKMPVKVVLTCHLSNALRPKYVQYTDGLVVVNPSYIDQDSVKNKHVVYIPPFFDMEAFESFHPTEPNKISFFKKQFNVQIKKMPILCSVARLYPAKNQELIIKAVAQLIHKKKQKLQLVLAGDGGCKKRLQHLCDSLNISEYVYFLGATNVVPELLFHSDIKVLPSKSEAFGIVLMEAALLKKPSIGSKKTGMENIITDKITGLLFENNDLNSLVEKIEILLKNPELAKRLGENAYTSAKAKFNQTKLINNLEQFYDAVSST